jgi:hypothetical protein
VAVSVPNGARSLVGARPVAEDLVFFLAAEPAAELTGWSLRPHFFLQVAEKIAARLAASMLRPQSLRALGETVDGCHFTLFGHSMFLSHSHLFCG